MRSCTDGKEKYKIALTIVEELKGLTSMFLGALSISKEEKKKFFFIISNVKQDFPTVLYLLEPLNSKNYFKLMHGDKWKEKETGGF
jgi:hypothetical protein